MPIPVSYQINNQPTIDLASLTMQQRQLQQQKQQQNMVNIMALLGEISKTQQFQQQQGLEKQKFGLQEREQKWKETPQLAEIANAAWMAKMTGDEEGFQRYSKLYTDILNSRTMTPQANQINIPVQQPAISPLQPYQNIISQNRLPLRNTMDYLSSLPQNQPISPYLNIGTPSEYANTLFNKFGLPMPTNAYNSIVNKYGLEE